MSEGRSIVEDEHASLQTYFEHNPAAEIAWLLTNPPDREERRAAAAARAERDAALRVTELVRRREWCARYDIGIVREVHQEDRRRITYAQWPHPFGFHESDNYRSPRHKAADLRTSLRDARLGAFAAYSDCPERN